MPIRATRRTLLACGLAALAAPAGAAMPTPEQLGAGLADLERRTGGGRLGVAVLGGRSGRLVGGHRPGERFPMCSTFKTLAGALLLRHVDEGRAELGERVRYGQEQLVEYSPATEKQAGSEDGMTLAAIAEAAITLSDNTAGNLLLDRLGGPAAITGLARALGDRETRLDRREPELNEGRPGDPRDTTTPEAMARTLRALLYGDALRQGSRRQLADWLAASRTGAGRLRAGLPEGWRSGTKTGTGGAAGLAADVGFLVPPNGAEPLVVAAYLGDLKAPAERQNEILAAVGRIVSGAA
jgi:beta-lactamase class A